METLFGLPAHSFLIHAPIVLLPIAAIATVAFAARPRWRKPVGWWFPAGVFVTVAMVFLARQSGLAFDDALDGSVDTSRHEDLANGTLVLTISWFIAATVTVALDRKIGSRSQPTASSTGEAVDDDRRRVVAYTTTSMIAAGFAVLATIWLARTGHEGADLVWRQTSNRIFG